MSNTNWKRKKKRIHIRPQYKLKSFYGYTIHICTGKQWSHTSIISGPYFSKNCRFSLCLAPFSLCPSASNHSLFRKDCAATAENFQNLKLLTLKKKCKPVLTLYLFLLLMFWRWEKKNSNRGVLYPLSLTAFCSYLFSCRFPWSQTSRPESAWLWSASLPCWAWVRFQQSSLCTGRLTLKWKHIN